MIKAGQRFDTLVENVDFAPTLLDFAGATIPSSQSKDVLSVATSLETGQESDDWKKANILSLLDAHGPS